MIPKTLLAMLVGSADVLLLESFYKGIVLWNCLSQAATEATNLSSVKKLYYT